MPSTADADPRARPRAAEPRPPTAPLTARIAKGDEQAFGEFYELWFDRAFALARKLTRSDESFCLDVVQDCMLAVVRSIRALETEAAVEAWMARTLLTRAIDRMRAERRRGARERRAARDEARAAEHEVALFDDEQAAWLRARILELPERDQRLIALRFVDDRTLAATGEALGLSVHAVHGRLRRIISNLRDRARRVFDD